MVATSRSRARWALLLSVLLLAASVFMAEGTAGAAPTQVGLGTATSFAIRADDGVSDTPTSTITGDVGLDPAGGASYTGLTCAEVNAGAGPIYSNDGAGPACPSAANAGLMTTVRSDATTAFNHTSALPGATPVGTLGDLAGLTLVPGLYSFVHGTTSNLGGTLNLDAQGNPNAVWIFQASSDLVTATSSVVQFLNAPAGSNLACNVYWTVQSSATLNASSTFVGTILASASITLGNAVTVNGRLLAGNAAGVGGNVTLIADTIHAPTGCATLPAGTGGSPATIPPPTVSGVPHLTG